MSAFEGSIRRDRMKRYKSYGQAKADVIEKLNKQRRAIRMARRTAPVPMPRMMVSYARHGELKGIDINLGQSPVVATTNTVDNITIVNLVREGSGAWARVGRKILMKSLRVKGTAALNIGPTATTSDRYGNTLRMAVVYDRQPSGSLPTFEDIFNNQNYSGGYDPSVLAPLRFTNTFRFQVIRDTLMTLNPEAIPSGGTENDTYMRCHFDEYIRLNLETQYSGTQEIPTNMTIADISSGALYVIFRGITNVASSYWGIDDVSSARLRYSDD